MGERRSDPPARPARPTERPASRGPDGRKPK
ncbi:hypothetical protein Ae168Ps1_2213c [Pseudonocardia sp. Ae168_Ps1]|nr:hypothetical protein Ae150APs1_2204c [Pseudonocardia sp. Ae150A_Ps1]OLL79807.1 hypothetical protein Ae168Ps1_2213c [Pseudonocardia sp. Ae168_Ps1]OLL86060.1 hypothetical protein Ae263Ps1_3115 [Pseudonocardia sp. Ae263_Ps1]OLL93910.1 hypothetical protein Ae356Ps1_3807c [Pseudonocardia sp. Ae356_Ps1]